MKSSYASKLCIQIYMLVPLHSIIERGEREKFPFLPQYGNVEYSLMTARTPMIDESQWKGEKVITLFSVLSNVLQNIRIAC